MIDLQDKCRGSLVGGAVGDALGYAVEFSSLDEILSRYGERGITSYDLDSEGVAEFSDDTQMTLFTAEGLLGAIAGCKLREADIVPFITDAYKHWYITQTRGTKVVDGSFLTHVRRLWAHRAPGNTCLSALGEIYASDRPVVNNSKGCGGIMRVAPIGIFAAAQPQILSLPDAETLAGHAAEITHKHPLSTLPSMAQAMIVADCITHDDIDREKFRFIVTDRVFKLLEIPLHGDYYLSILQKLTEKALDLAVSDLPDTKAIARLGGGWVAEETLAIAVFSVMRYIDNFEKCICCAVNHSGDSDSTGAVAGNIIGGILGYDAIPVKYLDNLELHDLLVTMADDLAGCTSARQMAERYVDHVPFNVDPTELL